MEDLNLNCSWKEAEKVCGKEFVFTKGEQDFYEMKRFVAPKYCHEHRLARRQKQNAIDEEKRKRMRDDGYVPTY